MILLSKISVWTALAGLAGMTAYTLHAERRMDAPDPPPPITPAARPAFARSLAAAGLVEACGENISVGSPADGIVTRVLVQVWDRVEAGQPLFVIDDRELQVRLLAAAARVRVQTASLGRLQKQLIRLQALRETRVIATEELETRQSDVEIAEAELAAARSAGQQTQMLIERLTVRAPAAGTILAVNLHGGEYVSAAARRPPVILGEMSELQVRADVDEQLALLVQSGHGGTGYLKGDAAHPFPLRFVRIEPFVVPKTSLTGNSNERVDTRTLQVIYRFASGTLPVYVGQQMDVFIDTTPSHRVATGG